MFKSKQELKDWINEYIENKGKRSLHVAIRNSNSIKEDILHYTSFLPDHCKYNQRCFHILNDTSEIPICKECGINKVNFNNRDKDWKYLDFCSVKCGRNNEETVKKYKNTLVDKYGVDNISKSQYFLDLMKKMNSEKYGVDWYQQSEDFRNKSIITCLKKYGFDNYAKTDEFKIKIKETILNRYGVDWYSKSVDFRKKFKLASLKKYGVDHPMLNDEFRKKVSDTMEKRYGKKWYVLTREFKEHCFENNELRFGNPTNGFKYKEYRLPSGKVLKVQGYENFALDLLIQEYREDDICVSYYEIKDEVGSINYFMDEVDRIYLPDIYIKSENKIIEVKSEYTYEIEEVKNILKRETCLDMGMKFEFWIFDKKGNLIKTI